MLLILGVSVLLHYENVEVERLPRWLPEVADTFRVMWDACSSKAPP